MGLFKKKDAMKLDLWRIKDQIDGDGYALMLCDKDVMPLKLMYSTEDVMDGETLLIDRILEKHGYKDLDLGSFDGYIITGEVKGRHIYAEGVMDFKEINGLG